MPRKSLLPFHFHMWRRPISALLIAATLGVLAFPSKAQTSRPGDGTITVDELPENRYIDLVQMLDRSGYRIISLDRTWLNRIRIRASTSSHLREIVFSQASGEVLRDVILEHYTVAAPSR